MVDQATFQGNWNQIKGKLKEKWGQLTDDDLRSFNGNLEQLIGRVQQRTGETRQNVEEFLGGLSGDASSLLEQGRQMAESAVSRGREMVGQTMDRSREMWSNTSNQMTEGFSNGYAAAEDTVKAHPAQSVAIAFAAGLLTGVGVAILLSTRQETAYERNRRRSNEWGNYMYDVAQRYVPDTVKQYMHG